MGSVLAGQVFLPFGVGKGAVRVDGFADRAKVFGVIGDSQKVEGHETLLWRAHVLDGLFHSVRKNLQGSRGLAKTKASIE